MRVVLAMTDSVSEQALDEPFSSSTDHTSHLTDLQYPQLYLQASFDSLLAHSIPSSTQQSITMDNTQQGPPSLSESWTSVSDVDYSHDEDLQSEHTDVGSLIDLHSTEDVHSVRDGEPESEADITTEDDEPCEEGRQKSQLKLSEHTAHVGSSMRESGLLKDGHITLEEPEFPGHANHVLVKHKLRVFSRDEMPDLGFQASRAYQEYTGSIHVTLSKHSIKDLGRQNLRVLFFAAQGLTTRDLVVGKIADALITSGLHGDSPTTQSPSSYHVVPDSFGPGSEPKAAEVIPISCQLDVDEYHSAIIGGTGDTTIMLCNEDAIKRTFSKWDDRRGQYVINDGTWNQPDLAIIVFDSFSTEQNASAFAMKTFAERHQIPSILLRTRDRQARTNTLIMLDESSTHLCIEGHNTSRKSGNPFLARIPLDLDTFLSLNASQLSRQIAYRLQQTEEYHKDAARFGAPFRRKGTEHHMERSEKAEASRDPASEPSHQPTGYHARSTRVEQLILSVLTCLGGLILLYFCGFVLVRGLVSFKSSCKTVDQPSLVKTRVCSLASPRTQSVAPIVSTSSLSSIDTVKHSVQTQLSNLVETTKPASSQYEVEAVGTSHLVVKVPERVKSGTTNIEVFKKGIPVHAEVTKLFPSVYSVRIIPEHAFGEVVVKISSRKTQLVEAIPVDMGEQPLDVWFKNLVHETEDNLRQQLALVQRSIEELRNPKRPRAKKLRKAFKTWSEKTARSIREYDWETPRHQLTQALRKHQAVLTKQIEDHSGAARAKFVEATQTGTQHGKALAEQLAKQMSKVYDAFDSVQFRNNLEKLSRSLQERTQSETLATAQERAHQIVQDARRKWKARHHGSQVKR